MKSIIQKDKTHCFICGQNASVEPLDEHHVFFGTANRKKSEQYGLKVYLHHQRCHLYGIHTNSAMNRAVQSKVQEIAMNHYGWTTEEFIKIFGKNFL